MEPTTKTKPPKTATYKQYGLEWPNNLLDSIFGKNFHKTNTVTEDQLYAINYVITTSLDDRQQKVIHYRFKESMLLVQIAEIFGVTRERIRQIESKAIHTLKHPVRKKIIQMGLNAFYEQDIKNLYYIRQNLLTTNLSDVKTHYSHNAMRKVIKMLIQADFQTVGDLMAFTLADKSRLNLPKSAYMAIIAHYQSVVQEQNMVIASLETHTGNHATPIMPYPTNLLDAIYCKKSANHTGALPTQEQSNGLNAIIDNNLSPKQREILHCIYIKGLSAQECGQKLHLSTDDIKTEHRKILRTLRSQPDCYAYIDGISTKPVKTTTEAIFDTNIKIVELDIHENIKRILTKHGIDTVQTLLTCTDEEIMALPHIGQHILSELNKKYPTRQAYARTCSYLKKLGMSTSEQKAYLQSKTYLQSVDLSAINLSDYRNPTLYTTAKDILLTTDEKISDEIRNTVRKAICLQATHIKNMGLSVRAVNALRNAGIHNFNDIQNLSDEDLLDIRNLGKSTLQNIRTVCNQILTELN